MKQESKCPSRIYTAVIRTLQALRWIFLLPLSEGHNRFILRGNSAAQGRDQLSVFVDEKLMEVPLDLVVSDSVQIGFAEPRIDRVLGFPLDRDLFHHCEGDTVVPLTEFADFRCVSWFLPPEVVAREAQDNETFAAPFLVQLLEFSVLRGVAALRSGVDDDDPLAAERAEVK